MNFPETCVFTFSLFVLFLYLLRHCRSFKQAVFLSSLSLPPLYFSIEQATQFLTIDERYIILEPVFMKTIPLMQFQLGALRTTDGIMGAVFSLIYKMAPLPASSVNVLIPPPWAEELAKSLHWFMGFVMMLFIHHIVRLHFVSEKNKAHFFILFIYSALLLPPNALALKIFNYDLFSMVFAVCGVVFALLALKARSLGMAAKAVLFASLAAQEKLTASPVLLLSCLAFCHLYSAREGKLNVYRLFPGMACAAAISLSVGVLTFLVAGAVRGWHFPGMNFLSLSFPLTGWTWPLLFSSMSAELQTKMFDVLRAHFFLQVFFLFFCLFIWLFGYVFCFCAAAVFPRLMFFFRKRVQMESVNMLLGAVALCSAVAGAYAVNVYIAPLHPVKTGYYMPSNAVNQLTWHFGAQTFFLHTLHFILYSFTAFVSAVPLVFWGAFFAARFYAVRKINSNALNGGRFASWEWIIFVSLVSPLAYGLANIPSNGRYYNIFIFLFAMAVLIMLCGLTEDAGAVKKCILTACFVCLLFAEVFPFRPLYAPFRPFWYRFSRGYSRLPVSGQVNGTWPGWGEEVMLAGKEIKKRCVKERGGCADVRVFHNYQGEWVRPGLAQIYFMLKEKDKIRYTKDDYYILNRNAAAQNYTAFPYKVLPLFTLDYRGFTQAWIFRGDSLSRAHFRFF